MGKRAVNNYGQSGWGNIPIDASPGTILTGQTGLKCFMWKAPFRGILVDMQTYAHVKAGTVTFDLQNTNNSNTSFLASPVGIAADAVTVATLSASFKALLFQKGDVLALLYTTDGSGALTNPNVTITVRPYPMQGEAGVGP